MLQTPTNLIFNGLQVSWLPTDQQILWILRPHPVPTGLRMARRPVTCMDIPARWSRPGLTHFCHPFIDSLLPPLKQCRLQEMDVEPQCATQGHLTLTAGKPQHSTTAHSHPCMCFSNCIPRKGFSRALNWMHKGSKCNLFCFCICLTEALSVLPELQRREPTAGEPQRCCIKPTWQAWQ